MKISYNWLKEYLPLEMNAEQTAKVLTDIGLEVEGTEVSESIPGGLQGVVTAQVLTCREHPNSDHLHITTVDAGQGEPLQIVCGAPNVAAGQKVLLATIGTSLTFSNGETVKIKKGKMRGEESLGMICAEDELGIGTSHEGIMVLPEDTPVGMPAKEYLHLEEDTVFEIGLTPNRIDAASHIGVARDLVAWFASQGKQVALRRPAVDAFTEGKNGEGIQVEVLDPQAAPRYSGVTLTHLHVGPSPDWMQKRLLAVGLRPINNVVDITNYVMLETGQPLHAFDRAKIYGDRVVVRLAKEGRKFVTLDGVERTLDGQDLMICDMREPMCLAGVFGGMESGVTEATEAIFLESAYFHPVFIRKSSKRHGLKTDASFRFERGADPNATLYVLKRAALLMQELCGAHVEGAVVDLYPEPIQPAQVALNYQRMFSLMGKNIGKDTVDRIVASLEMKVLDKNEEGLTVEVPTYRVDVQRECDVVEDVLRIYGYNQIELPNQVKASVTHTPKPNPESIKNSLANRLAAQGFREIMCNSLTKADYYAPLTTYKYEHLVRVLNPLSSDLNAMRQTLLWGGLESIAYNVNRQQYDLRFFELGHVYTYDSQADTPEAAAEGKSLRAYREGANIALFATGKDRPQNWHTPDAPVDFFGLKAYVEQLFQVCGLNLYHMDYEEAPADLFDEGIRYTCRGKVLAEVGQVSKRCCAVLGIKQKVFAAEIRWDLFFKLMKNNKVQYQEMPRFPEVHRDLALVVDEAVSYAQLRAIAFRAEKKLLKRTQLFDVYKGLKLPAGKKQYAMSFVLQDLEKTLTDANVEQTMSRLLEAFQKDAGAVLR